VDSAQASAASYRYDPYGRLLGSSGGMSGANVYRFSSKEWLSSLGLYYFGYRFYDPNLQRWINRDPIQENGGVNLYGFVANGAINAVDQFGLIKYADAHCEILYELPNGCDCMWLCECPRGYSMGYVRAQFPYPCDRTPTRRCFKYEGSDYAILALAAALALADGPLPIGDLIGGWLAGSRLIPLIRPALVAL
jgi:RHS repeat-associated protein